VLDRLPEQIECCDCILFFPRVSMREGTQIEIIRGQVAGRPISQSADLGHLQCRLDDASDARSHFVLKFEHVF